MTQDGDKAQQLIPRERRGRSRDRRRPIRVAITDVIVALDRFARTVLGRAGMRVDSGWAVFISPRRSAC